MRSALLQLLVLTAITVTHCTEELNERDEGLLPITSINSYNVHEHRPIDGAQLGKDGTWWVRALGVKAPYVGKPRLFQALSSWITKWAERGMVRNQ